MQEHSRQDEHLGHGAGGKSGQLKSNQMSLCVSAGLLFHTGTTKNWDPRRTEKSILEHRRITGGSGHSKVPNCVILLDT